MSERIRAVCSDVDDTLIFGKNKLPSPGVQAAAGGLIVPLVLVTARNPERLLPFLDPAEGIDLLNLRDSLCVIDGGSTVMRANTGEVVWSQKVSRQIAWNALSATEHLCTDIQFNGIPKELRKGNVLKAVEAGEILTEDVPSLFLVSPRTNQEAMREALTTIEGIDMPVFMDWKKDPEQFCLQIGGTKKRGLREALHILGLTEGDEVLKIGDGTNDISMMQAWAGPNVAMGNSHADLLAMPEINYIAPRAEHDGWATAMHEYRLVA